MLQAHEAERKGRPLSTKRRRIFNNPSMSTPSKRKMVESQTEVDNKDKDTRISRELKPLKKEESFF